MEIISAGDKPPPYRTGPEAGAYEEVRDFLRAFRRRYIALSLLNGALWGGLLVLGLAGLGLLASPLVARAPWLRWVWGAGVLAALGWGGRRHVVPALLRSRRLLDLASLVEKARAGHHNLLTNALSLGEWLVATEGVPPGPRPEPVVSRMLAAEAVRTGASALPQVSTAELLPRGEIRRGGILFMGAALVFAAATAIAPGRVRGGLAVLTDFLPAPALPPLPVADRGSPLGDVTITLRYPEYTKLPPATIPNSTGEVAALKGTEVEIDARSGEDLGGAFLLLEGKDASPIPMAVTGGRNVSGRFTLTQDGTYEVRLADPKGEALGSGLRGTLRVEPDRSPEVDLVAPEGDKLTVHERDRVEVRWSAHDDFGITKLSIALEGPGGKSSIPIEVPSPPPPEVRGSYALALAPLDLKAGDRVALRVEALDNDAVSGPKRGLSRTLLLEVYSEARAHEDLLGGIERATERLLQGLGDELENDLKALATRPQIEMQSTVVDRRLEGALADLGGLVTQVAADRLASPATRDLVRRVRDDLTTANRRKRADLRALLAPYAADPLPGGVQHSAGRIQDRETTVLERSILALREAVHQERYRDLADLADQIARDQQRLSDLVAEARKGAPGAKEKLERALDAIERRLQALNRKMAQLAEERPDEFLNAEALKNLDAPDAARELGAIRRALQGGNMDEALKRAEDLNRALNQMASMLQEGRRSGQSTLRRSSEALDKLAGSLKGLEGREQKILDETTRLEDRARRQGGASLDRKVREFVRKALERTEKMRQGIGEARREAGGKNPPPTSVSQGIPRAEQSTRELESALRGRPAPQGGAEPDLRQAEAAARDAASELQWTDQEVTREEKNREMPGGSARGMRKGLKTAREAAEGIVRDFEELKSSVEGALTPADRARLKSLAGEQRGLKGEAEEAGREASRLSAEIPMLPSTLGEKVQGASEAMGRASDRLGEGEAARASPEERDALRGLQDARSSLEEAGRQMAQWGEGGGGPNFVPGGGPAPSTGQGEEGGQFGLNTEKVEIPGREAYKVPPAFREDVLKAMKEGLPEAYRDLNREYYEKLIH